MSNRSRTGRSIAEVTSWHDHFMNIAKLEARRSKDPRCQVGACIVSNDNKIVGVGYNCMPRGRDDLFNWDDRKFKLKFDTAEHQDKKFTIVCHAELNAIVNANRNDFTDCRIYATRIPCGECAKLLVQNNIKEVYYLQDKGGEIIKDMFHLLEPLGFTLISYVPDNVNHMIV